VVVQSETGIKVLGLEFPDGPVKPRPEKDVAAAAAKRAAKPRAKAGVASGKDGAAGPRRAPRGDSDGGEPPRAQRGVRSVPKVPLTKA
jgi:ATP-dependent Clp protease ATP-binding subunit ClpA